MSDECIDAKGMAIIPKDKGLCEQTHSCFLPHIQYMGEHLSRIQELQHAQYSI